MIEVKAPNRETSTESKLKVFLAGSIEMGKAEKWQEKIVDLLSKNDVSEDVVVFNPRRDDWDDTWIQDPTEGTQFHEQVTWELDHIQKSNIVLFYFDPNTKSPITLLELGLCAGLDKDIIVICDPAYFRYGNVKVVCDSLLSNVYFANDLNEASEIIRATAEIYDLAISFLNRE